MLPCKEQCSWIKEFTLYAKSGLFGHLLSTIQHLQGSLLAIDALRVDTRVDCLAAPAMIWHKMV